MQKLFSFATLLLCLTLLISCSDDDDGGASKISIGGDTSGAQNNVGYNFPVSASYQGAAVGSNLSATVTAKTGDIVTINISGSGGAALGSMFDSEYINASGDFSQNRQFINSSEGIAYVNAKGEQNVLVKYDSEVGDKWSFTTKSGHTIKSKVVHKSTDDDYMWGGMYIKVVKVEQDISLPGINKATYIANHRWGLVGIEVTLEDGSKANLNL
jgi:hypothetical protein